MEIIHGIYSLKPEHKGCVLTVGNFDGVHHGHRLLLGHLFAKSQELGVPSMLLTFEPQPREFFAGAKVPARLTRFREKITLLEDTELDRVLHGCLAGPAPRSRGQIRRSATRSQGALASRRRLARSGTMAHGQGADLSDTDQAKASRGQARSDAGFRRVVEASPMGAHLYRLEDDDRMTQASEVVSAREP